MWDAGKVGKQSGDIFLPGAELSGIQERVGVKSCMMVLAHLEDFRAVRRSLRTRHGELAAANATTCRRALNIG